MLSETASFTKRGGLQTAPTFFGLGLRFPWVDDLLTRDLSDANFLPYLELAPENYIGRGGKMADKLDRLAERYPLIAHGLTLSIGSVDPIDWAYLRQLKAFIRRYNIPWMSDHLCASSYRGTFFHDLLPLPFTEDAIRHVSDRARMIQDFLECPLALENVSYYLSPEPPQMDEATFIREILARADISLLLDINNVYVNAINHGHNPLTQLRALADANIAHLHIAGHDASDPDLIIDTHGEAIADPVWQLLKEFRKIRLDLGKNLPPLVIERDFNLPSLSEIWNELSRAASLYRTDPERPRL